MMNEVIDLLDVMIDLRRKELGCDGYCVDGDAQGAQRAVREELLIRLFNMILCNMNSADILKIIDNGQSKTAGMYAAGFVDADNISIGMYDGPSYKLQDMLNSSPPEQSRNPDARAVIIAFLEKSGQHEILFHWDEETQHWVRERQEGNAG